MNNRQTVIQQIRFSISQLSARNGSFEFEHLCRHLTRLRICSNILPATGPVQSGGDQGRDFETFPTYFPKSSTGKNSFYDLISEEPAAFACSLEKNPAKKNGKIEKDVNSILSSGEKVARIYFFSSEDIPVAKRHKIIEKIRKEKNIELVIHDAQSISELLADNELFWIANQYLNISADFYPRPLDGESWYAELLGQYKNLKDFSLTFEAFQEIKSALRHIYKDADLKIDLPFWLDKMNAFVNERERTIPRLSLYAIYEIFVASLIGMNNIQNQENNIREYFSKIENIQTQQEFTDFTNLMVFVSVSSELHDVNFTEEEINEWKYKIIAVTNSSIENTTDVNLLCKLHEVKFQQFLNGLRGNIDTPDDYFRLQASAIDEIRTLINLIPDAPFYPLVGLSKFINDYIGMVAELGFINEQLEGLAEQIDDLKALRIGEFDAAENLRDRAMIYLNSGNEIMAIKVLHKAKTKWIKEETRLALVLTLLMLSECYEKLKMIFAAKYFAMAAAHISIRDTNTELISYFIQSLTQIANLEYTQGAWLGFLQTLDTIFPVAQSVRKEFDLIENEDMKPLVVHTAIIKYVTNRFVPELNTLIDSKLSQWKWIGESIDDVTKIVDENYRKDTEDFFWMKVQEDLRFKPFNDVGKKRKISFNAYGINLEFRFDNDYQTNSVAEQAIATLQILIVELASHDLHLLKTNVEVQIKLTGGEPDFERLPSNDVCLWELRVPSHKEYDIEDVIRYLTPHYYAFAFSVLFEITLLKTEEFKEIMEAQMVDGHFMNLCFIGKLYEDFYQNFFIESKYHEFKREYFSTPFSSKPFESKSHALLEWCSDISRKFDEADISERIKLRYENSYNAIEITIKKLIVRNDFRQLVNQFRKEGYLDWQILTSVANAVINYKYPIIYPNETTNSTTPQKFMNLLITPESKKFIDIPMDLFTKENLDFSMKIMVGSFLASYQLENHSKTPSFSNIQEFLNERLKFNEIDIPEMSPFKF